MDKSSSDIELASSSGNLGVSTSVSRVTIASGNFSSPSTPGSPVPDLSGFVTRCPIRQHDFSRFYILPPPNGGRPILLDDEEMAVRQARREEEMNRYRKEREKMLEAREMDREARNQMKLMQLEEAERRQVYKKKFRIISWIFSVYPRLILTRLDVGSVCCARLVERGSSTRKWPLCNWRRPPLRSPTINRRRTKRAEKERNRVLNELKRDDTFQFIYRDMEQT